MTSNNLPEEFPKKEQIKYLSIDEIIKLPKSERQNIAKKIWGL